MRDGTGLHHRRLLLPIIDVVLLPINQIRGDIDVSKQRLRHVFRTNLEWGSRRRPNYPTLTLPAAGTLSNTSGCWGPRRPTLSNTSGCSYPTRSPRRPTLSNTSGWLMHRRATWGRTKLIHRLATWRRLLHRLATCRHRTRNIQYRHEDPLRSEVIMMENSFQTMNGEKNHSPPQRRPRHPRARPPPRRSDRHLSPRVGSGLTISAVARICVRRVATRGPECRRPGCCTKCLLCRSRPQTTVCRVIAQNQ